MQRTMEVIFAVLLVMTPQVYGADWPMYLLDITHSSFNPAESVLNRSNVAALLPKWQRNLGGAVVSGITVVGGVAYVGDWSGGFSAINVADGTLRWQTFVGITPPNPDCGYPLPTGVSSQAVVHNGIVYVGGGDAAVYALDLTSGAIVGRVPLGNVTDGTYLWSSFTLYGNALYIGIASFADCPLTRGGLARIDLSRPSMSALQYLVPPGAVGAGVWSTPAADPTSNTILVSTGTGEQDPAAGVFGGMLLKLDADSLALQAFFPLPTNSTEADIEWGSSPTLVPTATGRTLVLTTAKDGVLYAQDLQDLSPVWQTQLAVSGACPQCGEGSLSTPAFDGQRVYVGAGIPPDGNSPGSLYALEPVTGAILWMQHLAGTVIAPPTVANGVVYAPTLAGLQAFDAATGAQLWQDPTGTPQVGQVAVVDGVLYAGYVDGTVRAWAPSAAEAAAAPGLSPRPSGAYVDLQGPDRTCSSCGPTEGS